MPSILDYFFPSTHNIPTTIYDFRVPSISGGIIDFASFRGKKILIVNTASLCGFTPQYKELEALYKQHIDKLVIVGFPSNSFLFQDPGSNEKIAAFCTTTYGVTFPMAAKVPIKGFRKAPIYQWLTRKKYNGFSDNTVRWNFQKYLIDEQGKLTHIFSHKMSPLDREIVTAIVS